MFVISTSIDLLKFSNNSNTWLPQQAGGVRPVSKYPHATAYLRLPIPYTRMDIYLRFLITGQCHEEGDILTFQNAGCWVQDTGCL